MYQKMHWQETRANLYIVMKCLSFYLQEYDNSSAYCPRKAVQQEFQAKGSVISPEIIKPVIWIRDYRSQTLQNSLIYPSFVLGTELCSGVHVSVCVFEGDIKVFVFKELILIQNSTVSASLYNLKLTNKFTKGLLCPVRCCSYLMCLT